MPVQINEMIIRANIVDRDDHKTETTASQPKEINKDDIIRECTELIMEIINNKNQR